ncbi:MAG: acetyl-CoA carboxylase biotin carboxyl carrier protein [Bacteroidota bacterium]
MEYKEIQDLLKLVNKTNLTEVEIEKDDFKLKIKRQMPENSVVYAAAPSPMSMPTLLPAAPQPAQETLSSVVASEPNTAEKKAPAPAAEPAASDNLYVFKSPMIGTFYRATTPEADPFTKVGDQVEKGQVLCIIEAMKLFNEIESEVSGKIVKILVENAQPVEYDQDLFLIDVNG